MPTPPTTSSPRPTPEQWQRLVAEQEHGPLTQQAFCEARGVPYSSFTRWRRRVLEERDAGAACAPSSSAFVPLALATPTSAVVNTASSLSLTLADGRRIENIEAGNVAVVAALVAAL